MDINLMNKAEYYHNRINDLERENYELRKVKRAYHTALWLTLQHFDTKSVIIQPYELFGGEEKPMIIEQTENLMTGEITIRIGERNNGNDTGVPESKESRSS